MNIDTKGLDRIEEELIKRADLIKQEESLKVILKQNIRCIGKVLMRV